MWSSPSSKILHLTGAGLAWCLSSNGARAYDPPVGAPYCTPCGSRQAYPPSPTPKFDFAPPVVRPAAVPSYLPPGRRPAPPPRPVLSHTAYTYAPPAPIWSGLYLGGHVGYDIGHIQVSGLGSMGADGGSVGVHFGHNWQQGFWVLGLEMDTSVSRAHGGLNAGSYALDGRANVFSSLRARAGVTVDNLLLYGTAGFGIAQLDAGTPASRSSLTLPAFVIGAGLEWRHSAPISVRLEALYWDLGERSADFGLGSRAIDGGFATIRAGVTFHFE